MQMEPTVSPTDGLCACNYCELLIVPGVLLIAVCINVAKLSGMPHNMG